MSVFDSGAQSDWYAAGMLLMQLAFLVAGVWFASNFLKTIRGFQEQVGALVKLSVTSAPAEPHEASTIARRTLGEGSFTWGAPAKVEAAGTTEAAVDRGANRVWAGSERFLRLEPPTIRVSEQTVALQTETVDEHSTGSWRRMGSWLQTPIRVAVVNPQATGLRRMIQWLGTAAGS
jgi:hypothetical protein